MFVRIKKSGRNEYLQIVENIRDNNKIKQHVIATLGRLEKLRENGGIENIIHSLSRFSNETQPLSAESRPIRSKAGCDEILSEEKADWPFSEDDHIYKTIWEGALSGIYILQNGVFQALSHLAASFTGYRPGELVGQRPDRLVFPDDLEKVRKMARAMLKGKRMSPYEFRIVTKQGDVCWIMETVASTIYKGKTAVLGNFMNITQIKTVENKLLESENLYRAIFETTGTATIIVEDDMTISLLNSEFERMTGYRREDWEGKRKWPEYIPEYEHARMTESHRLRRIDPNLAPKNFEHDLIDSAGRIRRMFLTVDMIPGTKKSVSSFRDITDAKRAEQELKMKSLNLEELNTTLRVLLKQREQDREELEEKVLSNVKEFVLPYVEKVRTGKLDLESKAYLDVLESNLKDIIAPFSRKLSSKYMDLTPKEIQIAHLIKEGKTSKEIANIMRVSKSAVDVHRFRLRNKLGLNRKKANLKSHLAQYT